MSPTPNGVVAVAVMLTSLSTVAVGTRFFVRLTKRIQLKSDDWTILVALVGRNPRPNAGNLIVLV